VGVVPLFDGAGGFLWAGVGLLVKSGVVSQFRGIDLKRASSLRWIWLERKRADQLHSSINRLAQAGMEKGTYSNLSWNLVPAGSCRSRR